MYRSLTIYEILPDHFICIAVFLTRTGTIPIVIVGGGSNS